MELLSHPSLEEVSVMIVFSKLDRQAARQLHELKTLMRLEQIVGGGNNDVSQVRRRNILVQIYPFTPCCCSCYLPGLL